MDSEKVNSFMGITDVGQAEVILSQFRKDFPQDAEGAEKLLDDLLEALAVADPLVGEANDFHNFSVSISRLINDNQKTIAIVEKGLEIYPNNTDLLADAIKYGYSCGKRAECKGWYQTLLTIDKARWTWRAFSFSIDYLLDEWTSNKNADYTIESIIELAHSYQANIPDNEDAWDCEYQIYAGTNQKDRGLEVLENAIKKFRFCPRCWLRYADIMMDNGDFEKAEPIIKKILRNPKSRENINISYVHFLDGQCKLYKLNTSEGMPPIHAEDSPERRAYEDLVWSIYQSFRKALAASGIRENVKAQINEYIEELYGDSGIEFPDEWRYQPNG